MTASASVVTVGDVRLVGDLVNLYAGNDEFDAWERIDAALSTLTPQPAEQDAREAVAWRWRKADQGFGLGHWEYGSEPIKGASPGYYEIEALTQAAPDGWVLVPVEQIENALLDIRQGAPGYARAKLEAMLSASPAPPAQGAEG